MEINLKYTLISESSIPMPPIHFTRFASMLSGKLDDKLLGEDTTLETDPNGRWHALTLLF